MNEFVIGSLHIDEIEAAVSLIRSHSEEDGEQSGVYFAKFFPDNDTWIRSGRKTFVARNERGDLIGVVSIGPDKYETPEIVWIDWFYVDRAWHGKGVAQALWEASLASARESGIRKIYLDTSDSGFYDRAIAFYEKIGFSQEARLKDYDCPGEDQLILGFEMDR